jgi:hypothetical protein
MHFVYGMMFDESGGVFPELLDNLNCFRGN